MNINNQAFFSPDTLNIGLLNGGNGTVNVIGTSGGGAHQSSLFVDVDLEVGGGNGTGNSGVGTLTADSGGQIDTTALANVGDGANTLGTVTLSDTNTKWSAVNVGVGVNNGMGTINVQDGATLAATGTITLTNGDLNVTGSHATLTGTITYGSNSDGNDITVRTGGKITGKLTLDGSNGQISVSGKDSSSNTPSTFEATTFTVSAGADGTINVSNNGLFKVDSGDVDFSLTNVMCNVSTGGTFDASNSTVTVAGGTKFSVFDGGILNTGSALVDGSTNEGATVDVTGNNSAWNIQNSGTLMVTNGGSVTLNNGPGGGGSITVAGATTLSSNGTITDDQGQFTTHGLTLDSNASLTVKNGGNFADMGPAQTLVSGGATVTVTDSNSTFSTAALHIGSNGTVTVESSGKVAAGNTLVIDNTGTLNVSGGGTTTVGTTLLPVSDGTVEVGPGATLNNFGKIVGNLTAEIGSFVIGSGPNNVTGRFTNFGKLTPDPIGEPGTFTVVGDYTQGVSGILNIEVDGTNQGAANGYSLLVVTGNAQLAGTLEFSFINNYRPFVGQMFDFLQVGGTTTGAFNHVTFSGLPTTMVNGTLIGYTFTITSLTQNFVAPLLMPLLTPNQQAVGASLNTAVGIATGDAATILTSVNALTTSQQVAGAYDQLTGQRLSLFRSVPFDGFAFFSQQLDDHLANLRDGMTGLDTNGFVIGSSSLGSTLSQIKGHLLAWQPIPMPGLLSDTFDPLLAGVQMKAPFADPDRWSAFINGNVTLADIDSSADLSHASYTTGGVTMGVDYHLDRHWTVGALFGYTHTDADLDNEGSKGTIDTYSPGIFAAFADQGWYANGAFTYGYNSYTENRNIIFPGVNRTANGSPQGNQYSTNLDGGYEFHLGQLTIGPSAGLSYVHLNIGSFNEDGAGAASLNFADQDADSLRSRIGFDARWHTQYLKTDMTYHLSAHWQHEFMVNSQGITSSLQGAGFTPFTVYGVTPERDSALIDAGVDLQAANNVDVFLDYQTEAGQSNFFAQSVLAGVKIGF